MSRVHFIEVQDVVQSGTWERGSLCGQVRVKSGPQCQLAGFRLAALPVVSSNPPPPSWFSSSGSPAVAHCCHQDSPATRSAFISTECFEGKLDIALNLWNTSNGGIGAGALE